MVATNTTNTITIDGMTEASIIAELRSLEVMVGSSRVAYRDAQCRLGARLLRLRAACEAQRGAVEGGRAFKRMMARAGIDEHRAQRVMKVADRFAPEGEVDRVYVARLMEQAIARGHTNLPFVSRQVRAAEEGREAPELTFGELDRLGKIVSLRARATHDRRADGEARAGTGGTACHAERTQPDCSGAAPEPEGSVWDDEQAARALGMDVAAYRGMVEGAEGRRGEGTKGFDPSAPLSLGPSAPSRGARGEQMSLDAVYARGAALRRAMDEAIDRAVERALGGDESVLRRLEAALDA